MFQRFTLPILTSVTATALVASIAVSQSQPAKGPQSKPVAATGIVVGAPRMLDEGAMEFDLRSASGLLRVRPHSKKQMEEIRGGDKVRVFGRPLGRVIYGANVRLLQAKASDIADDYDQPAVERLDGEPREGSEDRSNAR